MQNEHETLGEIIKNARMKADITVEDLATKVGVTERFIYRIENEGKKPSYDILYKLIRELSILPDQIFFPEKQAVPPQEHKNCGKDISFFRGFCDWIAAHFHQCALLSLRGSVVSAGVGLDGPILNVLQYL